SAKAKLALAITVTRSTPRKRQAIKATDAAPTEIAAPSSSVLAMSRHATTSACGRLRAAGWTELDTNGRSISACLPRTTRHDPTHTARLQDGCALSRRES